MKNILTLLLFFLLSISLWSQDEIFYATSDGALTKVDNNGNSPQMLIPAAPYFINPRDMAMDYSQNLIFWADEWSDKIFSAQLDGSNHSAVLDKGDLLASPQSIVINSNSSKIYWSEENRIRSSNYDGTGVTDILTVPVTNPFQYEILDMEIDVANSKIYWSHKLSSSNSTDAYGISKADLDGSNLSNIMTTLSHYLINTIYLDTSQQKIFYSIQSFDVYPAFNPKINFINVDGSGDMTLVSGGVALGTWAIAKDNINNKFYIHRIYGDIIRLDSAGTVEATIASNISSSYSEEIILSPNDGKIYFINTARIDKINMDGSGLENVIINQYPAPMKLAYDETGNWIYWADDYNYISRIKPDGTNMERLVVYEQGGIKGFQINPAANKMNWTNDRTSLSSYNGKYHEANLDGTSHQVLIPQLYNDNGYELLIDTINQQLYWLYQSSENSRLRSLDMDGSNEQQVHLFNFLIQKMSIDIPNQKFVWVIEDSGWKIIDRSDMDGNNIEYLYGTGNNITALGLSANKIYWAEEIYPGGNHLYSSSLDGSNMSNLGYQSSYPILSIVAKSSSSLPVELASFNGFNKNGTNHIEWTTLSETNNKGFDLEKSSNGYEWKKLAHLEGMGNSTDRHTYTYEDEIPFSNENYYRLKQIDNDGSFEYSNMIMINNKIIDEFQIKTHVKDGILSLFIGDYDNEMNLFFIIVDTKGSILLQENIHHANPRIDISFLPSGLYYIVIENNLNNTKHSIPLVKP